jgi:hypothetical protein
MILLRKKSSQMNPEDYLINLPLNNNHIAEEIFDRNGSLPNIPPIEIHPYKDDFPLCEFEKYIIGTFPPISYIFEHPLLINSNIGLNQRPKIPFYHGNDATFWESFLSENEKLEFDNLQSRFQKKDYLIQVLMNSRINYSDIILSCKRSRTNSTNDSDLYDLVVNTELINHIIYNPNENVILNFNTSSIYNKKNFEIKRDGFLNEKNVQSLNIFIRSLQEMGYSIKINLNGNEYHNLIDLPRPNYHKVIFNMKIIKNDYSKNFLITTTPSPSGQASRTFTSNQIYNNWLLNQPENISTPTKVFRTYLYELFRNSDWDSLRDMNIYY